MALSRVNESLMPTVTMSGDEDRFGGWKECVRCVGIHTLQRLTMEMGEVDEQGDRVSANVEQAENHESSSMVKELWDPDPPRYEK